MNNWIKVSERLPEEHKAVLLYCYTNNFFFHDQGKFTIEIGCRYGNSFRLYSDENFDIPTHWMELP